MVLAVAGWKHDCFVQIMMSQSYRMSILPAQGTQATEQASI